MESQESPLLFQTTLAFSPNGADNAIAELLEQESFYVIPMDQIGIIAQGLINKGLLPKENHHEIPELDPTIFEGKTMDISSFELKITAPQLISYSLYRACRTEDDHKNSDIPRCILGSDRYMWLQKRYGKNLNRYRIYIGNLKFYELVAKELGIQLVRCDSNDPKEEFYTLVNAKSSHQNTYIERFEQLGFPFTGEPDLENKLIVGLGRNLRILFPGNNYQMAGEVNGYFEGSGNEFGIAIFKK